MRTSGPAPDILPRVQGGRRTRGGAHRAPRHRAPRRRSPLPVAALAVVLAGSVAAGGWLVSRETDLVGATTAQPPAAAAEAAKAPADTVLPWGPTEGELARARELVAGWSAERLVGQVIVGRYHGTEPEAAAAMVRELHLAGVSLQSENVLDADQVRATTAAVAAAVAADGRTHPPVIGVDQEGGTVSHLDGVATTFPAYAEAGDAVATDAVTGRTVVKQAAEATGLELRDLGFTWVFAPVADVTIGAADPTIGSRSPSDDPAIAADVIRASIRGYNDAGIVSTVKHFPGHGAVEGDSHTEFPALTATLAELRERDLVPFRAAIDAGAPAVMLGHMAVDAVAPDVPGSLAAPVYDLLRDDLGFDGLTITDSLGMAAVSVSDRPAVDALNAGADLLLLPADTAATHATVVAALEAGDLTRERLEDAAATVVAVQLWQQRSAAAAPVPVDVVERAAEAAAALEEADAG